MGERDDIFSNLEREISELHRFFQDWYNGDAPDTDEAFERFERALAPGFLIVTPQGQIMDRQSILGAVRTGHGSHGKSSPPISIWIEDVRLRIPGDELQVATYVEWQSEARDENTRRFRGRLSTGVYRVPSGEGAIEWLHVHETWLPPSVRPKSPPGHE